MINCFYSGWEINTFFLRCFAGSFWWELMMYYSLFSSSCSTQNSCIFHPPQRKFLSIRCKCGEMSYCVPLLVTCFWTHFLLRCCCWKSLHYASYPTVCKHHISQSFAIFRDHPSIFLEFLTLGISMSTPNTTFFVNNGFVNIQ